ncbi:MAG: YerC/YecD family TrpR-related protein [Thermincola sp.]|nr:YerC/YecD family TrpR-related protein [Thermincola sp.]MDT3704464.1 YerC/YecD family TrpR-related protein [Thermincola sp.]
MSVTSKLKEPLVDKLFEAVLLLQNDEECYRFFEDICTVAELKSMAQRLEVAKMLEENRTYGEIAEKTGASTATISRVKRALNYGADGYKLVFERLMIKANSRKK